MGSSWISIKEGILEKAGGKGGGGGVIAGRKTEKIPGKIKREYWRKPIQRKSRDVTN